MSANPVSPELLSYDGSARPSANTMCVRCERRGHLCRAHGYCGEEPVCCFCGNGDPCSQDRAIERFHSGPSEMEPEDGAAPGPVRTVEITEAVRAADQAAATPRPSSWRASAEAARLEKPAVVHKPAPTRKRGRVAAEKAAPAPTITLVPEAPPPAAPAQEWPTNTRYAEEREVDELWASLSLVDKWAVLEEAMSR